MNKIILTLTAIYSINANANYICTAKVNCRAYGTTISCRATGDDCYAEQVENDYVFCKSWGSRGPLQSVRYCNGYAKSSDINAISNTKVITAESASKLPLSSFGTL